MTTRRALLDALHAHLGPEYVCAENVTLGGPDGITVDLIAIGDGLVEAYYMAPGPAEFDTALEALTPRPGPLVIDRWWILTTPGVDYEVPTPVGVLIRQSNRIKVVKTAQVNPLAGEYWHPRDVAAFTRAAVETATRRAGWHRLLPIHEADWLTAHPGHSVIARAQILETGHLQPGRAPKDGWVRLGGGT